MDNYAFSVETYLLLQFLRWMIISWNQVIAYVRSPAGVKIFTEHQNQIIWLQKKKKSVQGCEDIRYILFLTFQSQTKQTWANYGEVLLQFMLKRGKTIVSVCKY